MAHENSVLTDSLVARGISRRDFVKFCGSVAVILGLSETMAPTIAGAIENAAENKLFPAIWMNGGACTGCTE